MNLFINTTYSVSVNSLNSVNVTVQFKEKAPITIKSTDSNARSITLRAEVESIYTEPVQFIRWKKAVPFPSITALDMALAFPLKMAQRLS